MKEGQKCGRSSILARIRPHCGVNGAAWRARPVGQVSSFSPFAHFGDGRLKRAQIGVMPTSRGRAGLDITSLTRRCTGRKSNGISIWIIRNVVTITRPLHLVAVLWRGPLKDAADRGADTPSLTKTTSR